MTNSATLAAAVTSVDIISPICPAFVLNMVATPCMASWRSVLFETAFTISFRISARDPENVFALSAARPWNCSLCWRKTVYLACAFSRSVRSFHAFLFALFASYTALT